MGQSSTDEGALSLRQVSMERWVLSLKPPHCHVLLSVPCAGGSPQTRCASLPHAPFALTAGAVLPSPSFGASLGDRPRQPCQKVTFLPFLNGSAPQCSPGSGPSCCRATRSPLSPRRLGMCSSSLLPCAETPPGGTSSQTLPCCSSPPRALCPRHSSLAAAA